MKLQVNIMNLVYNNFSSLYFFFFHQDQYSYIKVWNTVQNDIHIKQKVMFCFLLKFEGISSTYFIFSIISTRIKYSILLFLKQLLQKKLCFSCEKSAQSIHLCGWQVRFPAQLHAIINGTSDRLLVKPPCLPMCLYPTSMRFWIWKAHQWMMWITVHQHQRCCQDTPSNTTTPMKVTLFRREQRVQYS